MIPQFLKGTGRAWLLHVAATLGFLVLLLACAAISQSSLAPFLSPLALPRDPYATARKAAPNGATAGCNASAAVPATHDAIVAADNITSSAAAAVAAAAEVSEAAVIGNGSVATGANGGGGGGDSEGGSRWRPDGRLGGVGDVTTIEDLTHYTESIKVGAGQNRANVITASVLEAEAEQWKQRTYQQRGFLYEFSAYRMSASRFVVLSISSLDFLWLKEGEGCRWVGRDGSTVNGSVLYRDFMRPKAKPDALAAFCYLASNTTQAGGYLTMTMDGIEAAVFNEAPGEVSLLLSRLKSYLTITTDGIETAVFNEAPGQPLEPPPDADLPIHLTWCSQPLYGSTLDAGIMWAWAEYHRVRMGVERFVFYDMGAWSPSLSAVFAPFFASGAATVTDMNAGYRLGFLAGGGPQAFLSKHQTLANNDCIFRSLATSRWVTLHDTDEFLHPVPPHTLSSLLATHADKPWVSHGALNVDLRVCAGGELEKEGNASQVVATEAARGNSSEGEEARGKVVEAEEERRRAVAVLSRFVFREVEASCMRDGATEEIETNLCEDWRGHRKLIVNPRKTWVMSIHMAREPQTGGAVLNAGTELRHYHLSGVVNPFNSANSGNSDNARCHTLVPPGESHGRLVRDTTVVAQLPPLLLDSSSATQE